MRLTAHEAKEHHSSGMTYHVTFPICEKLRPRLAALVGNNGFGVLLSRALALAIREAPWLREVHVKPDGSLEELSDLEAPVDPEKLALGQVALLGQLLGLLKAFIGETVTMQVIGEVYPKLSLDDPYPRNGD